MGEVYRAKDTRLERTVAIKVIVSDVAGDSAFQERFEREASAVSSWRRERDASTRVTTQRPLPDALRLE